MRAAFVTGPERLEVRDTNMPPLASGQVRLAIKACGVCGSNLHAWRHPDLDISKSEEPAPGADGHEIAALVEEVAADVTAWKIGDRVVVEVNLIGACRKCEACEQGRYWFCRDRSSTPAWGFSQEMVVSAECLFRIPEKMSDEVATLVEPLACAVHAIRTSTSAALGDGRIDGCSVVILGAGVAGILAVVAAKHLGASHVAIMARYDHQATAAERVGADLIVRSENPNHLAELRSLRAGLVIEAVGGTADTLDTAMKVVSTSGEISVLGLFDKAQEIDVRRAVFRETRIFFPVTYGEILGVHDFEIALEAAAERAELLEPLASHGFNLDDIDKAFRTAADKSTGALRVVVSP